MGFTPIDIENQKFDVKMRGYDRDQVAKFLSALAEEATALITEKNRLEEETTSLKRRIQEVESRDKKLQETILALRDMTERMKQETKREGELTLREARQNADQTLQQARQKAEQIVQEARTEAEKLQNHIGQLRLDRETFENRLRMLLDEHQRLIAQRREDAAVVGNVPVIKRGTEAEQ
jgi:cell division initiation protein